MQVSSLGPRRRRAREAVGLEVLQRLGRAPALLRLRVQQGLDELHQGRGLPGHVPTCVLVFFIVIIEKCIGIF